MSKEDNTDLQQLRAEVPGLLAEVQYTEVFGVELEPASVASDNVLRKFLRANKGDFGKAREQLLATLKWRREFRPRSTLDDLYSRERFGGLGFVGRVGPYVAAFNIYGPAAASAETIQRTFGDLDGFLRWRVALMELTLDMMNLAAADKLIPAFGMGPDEYQGIQIHDYRNVSFLRRDPTIKAASSAAINLFSLYYPETMSRKFFVNVPSLMAWVFYAIKFVMPAETARKLTMLSSSESLCSEILDGADDELVRSVLPTEYGGTSEKTLEETFMAVKFLSHDN
ncbi:Non-classical phosphatidylinositol transfer protein (PITP) [Entophlyctis luteolus]|nr:Non-classical phosphatidylinositol transfer protein (PITP) [Entophlyctis luteolus]